MSSHRRFRTSPASSWKTNSSSWVRWNVEDRDRLAYLPRRGTWYENSPDRPGISRICRRVRLSKRFLFHSFCLPLPHPTFYSNFVHLLCVTDYEDMLSQALVKLLEAASRDPCTDRRGYSVLDLLRLLLTWEIAKYWIQWRRDFILPRCSSRQLNEILLSLYPRRLFTPFASVTWCVLSLSQRGTQVFRTFSPSSPVFLPEKESDEKVSLGFRKKESRFHLESLILWISWLLCYPESRWIYNTVLFVINFQLNYY